MAGNIIPVFEKARSIKHIFRTQKYMSLLMGDDQGFPSSPSPPCPGHAFFLNTCSAYYRAGLILSKILLSSNMQNDGSIPCIRVHGMVHRTDRQGFLQAWRKPAGYYRNDAGPFLFWRMQPRHLAGRLPIPFQRVIHVACPFPCRCHSRA
ncbi:hypothetical protein [Novacetimonas pomaceti]|uniref:hypothetical protein n=1 Tax=Novacetimonas pomaceti TaxID=2021998 RepID=UPI001057D56F|nr:hypothetical protein [Novacetimonas pomaceti]